MEAIIGEREDEGRGGGGGGRGRDGEWERRWWRGGEVEVRKSGAEHTSWLRVRVRKGKEAVLLS